jgi:hypothetical protein
MEYTISKQYDISKGNYLYIVLPKTILQDIVTWAEEPDYYVYENNKLFRLHVINYDDTVDDGCTYIILSNGYRFAVPYAADTRNLEDEKVYLNGIRINSVDSTPYDSQVLELCNS